MAQAPNLRRQLADQEQQAISNNVAKIEAEKTRKSALAKLAERLDISSSDLKDTLMATAFKGASAQEFAALVIVANEYGLNPLTKEIYAFPQKGGGIVPVVGVDGWIRIMNEHPQFDGIEFNDIPDESGKLYAIEAIIYRKDRTRPIKVVEYLEECKRNTEPWNKSPARMLRHRSLIQAARYAFGFSGLVDENDVERGEISLTGNSSPPPMRDITPRPSLPPQQNRPEPQRQAPAAQHATTFDPETGEITDDSSPTAAESEDARGAIADRIIAEMEAASTIIDLNRIYEENEGHIEALDDDNKARVYESYDACKQKLGAK